MTESAHSWTEYPLVTGLMVFNRVTQYRAARHSIESFFNQSWPNKELVIYNPSIVRLIPFFGPRRAVKEIKLAICDEWLMMTVCHANANGEWCANWRSDCIYDPTYLKEHMAHRDKQRLVRLKNRQAMAINGNTLSAVTDASFPAWSLYRHFAVDFRKPLAEQLEATVLDNAANLLIQIVSEVA